MSSRRSHAAIAQAAPEHCGLAPMQSGMLYHTLLTGPHTDMSGYDIQQLHVKLDEALDVSAFERAFTLVVHRHPILATAFRWEGIEMPEQDVHVSVAVPVETRDIGGLSSEERARRCAEFLIEDRLRGFDLRLPPLLRATIFLMGDQGSELVWSFHHILLDGRSMIIVLRDLFDAYAAIRAGLVPRLPHPPLPYSHYLGWLASLDLQKSLGFFADLLEGKSVPTPLPGAEPMTHLLPREGYGRLTHFVPSDVVTRARELALSTNSTFATVVHAAWALVLSRFTGDNDVLFGTPRACRRSALGGAAVNMVGLFMNTLPVRARVHDTRSVRDLLVDLRAQSLSLRAHEHTSLVEIQSQSPIPRGVPLFETLVMFENQELNQTLRKTGGPGWQGRQLTLHEQPSVPLSVVVLDAERLELRMLFDRRRFTDASVERLLRALATALDALGENPERPLGELEVLSAAERQRILVEWNTTARPYAAELCIHDLFERRVDGAPQAIALEMDGVRVSYGELEVRANRLAHALRRRGARPGVYVGICLERGVELIVALLAVAKSGAAYVPFEPHDPEERLRLMLDDAGVRLLVTERRHHADGAGRDALFVDTDAEELANMASTRPERSATSSDVCYAIFTSGSTGKPKAVVLSHRAVVNTFDWVTRTFAIGPTDRLLFVTSPCFDLSVYDIFGVLGAGATVVIASSTKLERPEVLARAIVDERITIWDSAPAALQRLVSYFPDDAQSAPLRRVLLSGDWIPLGLPGAIHAAFPRAEITSLGGATEVAIWSNWFPIGELDPRWSSIPYGRPIQNIRYHVLDRRLKPVPVGIAGELYIGGVGLAEGYLNRPELTRERFILDPFADTPHERLYKTGDLARYFEDGNIEFLGRTDLQVKIRGYRVELGEVEAALGALPEVKNAVCNAYLDASGQKSLAAYVVLRPGAVLGELAIKQHLASSLPEFMVPSQVAFLDALPLSQNGKVDRKALVAVSVQLKSESRVMPRTPLERDLARIWEEVLKRQPIGVHDDFFALGGHSLLAVLLISKIGVRLGVEVPLSRILQRPTIEALAESISGTGRSCYRHLVTLNAKGARPPLVLAPGSGGYGFIYQHLPALLSDQPVHILQAIGAESESPLDDLSIEQMAELYEPEVLDACPHGPIVLGGYSFGVLVAFALAQRLRLRGREVPLLVSIDGFAPGHPRRLPIAQRLLVHAKAILWGEAGGRRQYLHDRLSNLKFRLFARFHRADQLMPEIEHAQPQLNQRMHRVWASLRQARNRYAPSHVEPSELLLIKAQRPIHWPGTVFDHELYGWGGYVNGKITCFTVPGAHLTLFDEANQRRIAEAVTARMVALGL